MSDEKFEIAVLWLMGTFFLIILFFVILYLGGVFDAAPYRDDRIIIHSSDGPNMRAAEREAIK